VHLLALGGWRDTNEKNHEVNIMALIRSEMCIEGDASDGEAGASPDFAARAQGVESVAV
jgi:hypothetical protein